jgi:predicted P-loop ATPase
MATLTFSNAIEAATWYHEHGIFPIPVSRSSKKPVGTGWEDQRLTVADIPHRFDGDLNIGGLLGISTFPDLGLVDLDLDCPEAIAVAPDMLPPTGMVFGHASAPASHYEYFVKLPAPRIRKFADPLIPRNSDPEKRRKMLEIRGRKKPTDESDSEIGLQTVLPGSSHVSGEQIEFLAGHDGQPSLAMAADLERIARQIFAASLFVRYWPASGNGRHDAMLALAGALAYAHWPQDNALWFCDIVYKSIPTHDPAAIARVVSEVEDSYAKVAADLPATGFPTLTNYVDFRIVSAAFDSLGLPRQRTALAVPWGSQFAVTPSGVIKPDVRNILIALRNDPKWEGLTAYDEFSQSIVAGPRVNWPHTKAGVSWTNAADIEVTAQLQRDGIGIQNTRTVSEALTLLSHDFTFHPVRDFLHSLTWDGQPRVGSLFPRYFGAEDSAYNREVGKRWTISGVARIERPGCKADHVPMLYGVQGSLKSTTVQTLAVRPEWFTDHLSDLGLKDSRQDLRGKWIIELAEMDAISRGEISRYKAFISAQSDHYRPSYARHSENFPRQCVFIGTTNDDAILRDPSGNRRWWPVTCGTINLVALIADRDQIWAEAVHLFNAGEPWHITDPALVTAAAVAADEHYAPGQWDQQIIEWCTMPEPKPALCTGDEFVSSRGSVQVTEILLHGLGIPVRDHSQAAYNSVVNCLRHEGYVRTKKIRVHGRKQPLRFYVKNLSSGEGE